ncbi:ABC transporter ATP-binding protein [Yoonia sp.]|uniref:ABC transporter ATP-binding protein n=1 Tax=Yoonia sp. TaxID=2212373 RepID=UPI002FDB32E9
MPDPVLEIRGLSINLGGGPYVKDVSLRVSAGRTLGLLGPNGAGKTTILRAIYTALPPTRGEIVLNGVAKRDWRRADWARAVGALVQGDGLLAGLTPVDIVDIGLKPLGLPEPARDARREEALAFVGLAHKRLQSAENLSGGERQRCYFAQLLARDPALYVLDEPTNHLDLHFQLKLLDEVRRRKRSAIACFHDLAMAKRYCDDVAILEQGRIVAFGPPDVVLSRRQIAESYQVAAEFRENALHIDGPIGD